MRQKQRPFRRRRFFFASVSWTGSYELDELFPLKAGESVLRGNFQRVESFFSPPLPRKRPGRVIQIYGNTTTNPLLYWHSQSHSALAEHIHLGACFRQGAILITEEMETVYGEL